MKINSLYPVICTEKIAASKDFYTRFFNLETTFESDWYVSLKTTGRTGFELALLDPSHESLPTAFQKPSQGGLINVEVEDVDGVYDRLTSQGLEPVLDIRTEEWGQRHFIIPDPNGILVDVIQNTPPSEAYQGQYK